MTAVPTRDVLLTCPLDCPDACRLKVTLGPGVGPDGVPRELALKLTGDPDHPVTQGFACGKTVHYPARQNHPDRPLYPMKRVGGVLTRVSWDTALDEIAARLRAVLDDSGPQAVLRYNYAGTMGLREGAHVHSFFRGLGACELDETICATAGSAAWTLGYGPRYAPDPQDVVHARLILLWGINSLATHSHLTPFMTRARKAGAYIVHIDPYVTRTSRYADEHLALRPGTDTALALALARELLVHGWTDHAYLARAAEGLDDLRAAAEEWTLEHAAEVTGLSAEVIAALARRLGTTRPTYIRVGYGMTRHENGGTALRAVTLLPALTGDWQQRGGGCALSTSGAFALNRRMLGGAQRLRGRERHINMNELGRALAPEQGIGALFVYNCNPLVVAPDTGRVRAGLERPELLKVVLEQAHTETADYADYLLPATTFMEHADVYTAYGHHYLSYNPVTLAAPGEARPNSWIFAELGRRLGMDAPGPRHTPELYWSLDELLASLLDTEHPHLRGITLERLKAEGSVPLNLPGDWRPYADGAPTASGRVQLSPAPRYVPVSAGLNSDYPLRLLTPPAHHFLNSTYGLLDTLTRQEGGEPQLLVHPQDADRYGVAHGERARVISEQGEVLRQVRVTPGTQPGVVVAEGTWWGTRAPDGKGINELTAQTLTDLGGGSTFHNTRVQLRPAEMGRPV